MHQLLKHRYQILRVLSESGGFAQTFLGEITDMPSRRRCVIKKLRTIADPQDSKCAQGRFQREAAVLERLGDASDQIPKLYAYFVEGQDFYLVQEFVEGLTLRQIVQQGAPLGEKTVGELLIALLHVLAYVHEQDVIHRDIKPDNVILRRRDNKPVLIDFGIVKEVVRASGDGNPTHSMVAGTPGYISPEQAVGRPVFASDLYGLGVTAIFLLTGKSPRWLTDPATGRINWRQHVPRVSPAFAAILDKSTEMYARNRYRTAEQMSEDLWKALRVNESFIAPQLPTADEEETVVMPAAPHPPTPEPRRQNYALYFGIAATVLGLLVLIGSAAALATLGVQNRKGNAETKDEPLLGRRGAAVEKPRQVDIKKTAPSESTRARTPAPRATTDPTDPAPTESPLTPIVTANVPGIFPEASTRLLTASDLINRSQWELRVMRNEIFARHGYIFKTPEMRSYFASQRWYSPHHDDVSKLLSHIETRNAKTIRSSE
jgi:serine/threonine-protein kinase